MFIDRLKNSWNVLNFLFIFVLNKFKWRFKIEFKAESYSNNP